MKDCKNIHPLLSLHLEGELSQKEETLVQKHLAACITARRELEQFGRLHRSLLEEPAPKPPADLHARIMDRLGMQGTSSRAIPWRRPFFLAAAMLCVVFFANRYPGWREQTTAFPEGKGPQTPAAPKEAGKIGQTSYRTDQDGPKTASKKDEPGQKRMKERKLAAAARSADAQKSEDFAPEPEAARTGEKRTLKNAEPALASAAKPMEEEVPAGAAPPSEEAAMDRAEAFQGPAAGAPAPRASRSRDLSTIQQKLSAVQDAGMEAPATSFDEPLPINHPGLSPIWQGDNGPISGERGESVTRPEAFELYWLSLMPGQPAPEVDFSSQVVLLLLAGEKPTTGYSIRVSRTEKKGGNLVIHYRVEPPPSGTLSTQMITRPWSMTVIPKPSLPVVFQREN